MKVYAVIHHPQGSMGGFDWFYDEADAERAADEIGRDLILGIAPVTVEAPRRARTKAEADAITDEIDSRLLDLERRFGYEPSDCGNCGATPMEDQHGPSSEWCECEN